MIAQKLPVLLIQLCSFPRQEVGIVGGVEGREGHGGQHQGNRDPQCGHSTVMRKGRVSKLGHPVEVVVHRMIDIVKTILVGLSKLIKV